MTKPTDFCVQKGRKRVGKGKAGGGGEGHPLGFHVRLELKLI